MKERLTEEKIKRAMEGDRAVYDVIYRRCEPKLRSYITSHINDKSQVDDVVQNTFISVYNNISRLKSPDAFRKWIYAIAYNEFMDANKAVSKQRERSFPLYADHDNSGGTREFPASRAYPPTNFARGHLLQNDKRAVSSLNGGHSLVFFGTDHVFFGEINYHHCYCSY